MNLTFLEDHTTRLNARIDAATKDKLNEIRKQKDATLAELRGRGLLYSGMTFSTKVSYELEIVKATAATMREETFRLLDELEMVPSDKQASEISEAIRQVMDTHKKFAIQNRGRLVPNLNVSGLDRMVERLYDDAIFWECTRNVKHAVLAMQLRNRQTGNGWIKSKRDVMVAVIFTALVSIATSFLAFHAGYFDKTHVSVFAPAK